MIQQGPLKLLFSFLGPKDSFTGFIRDPRTVLRVWFPGWNREQLWIWHRFGS